ncbi:hypothetical protein [Actinomadura violacea]|uniref:Uncharacterized protein n=1 Tax=Actinomadura violacea TaxID=2819934 RepID=A0ABS3RW06_9ACTN|nr:hypothetical protein [Actinomadura violacea]MBO2460942.1 hypothetical protein [Actinomadura violacea]
MARGGGFGDIVLERPGRPSEGALDAVRHRRFPVVALIGVMPSGPNMSGFLGRLVSSSPARVQRPGRRVIGTFSGTYTNATSTLATTSGHVRVGGTNDGKPTCVGLLNDLDTITFASSFTLSSAISVTRS